jgi:CelD/BcsL family acetyltransferase involved in cellulose biosynthesis/ribosomal protein S18 acetylase RimI-like enzyme
MRVTCRLARPDDLDGVVAVLQKTKPGSFWAQAGGHLARTYFHHYLSGYHEILVVASRAEDGVVGACLGTGRPESQTRDLYRENLLSLTKALFLDVRQRPRVLVLLGRRFMRGLLGEVRRRMQSPSRVEHLDPELPRNPASCCYMSLFVVAPEARGLRLGTRMLDRFVEEMESRGFEWCRVHTTLHNVASRTAQERSGFRCVTRQGDDLTFMRRLQPSGSDVGRRGIEAVTLTNLDDVRALAGDWARLWCRTPEVSGFQSLEWLLACWEAAPSNAAICVMVVRAAGRSVAIFPTELGRDGRLSFIGSRLSNYSGPVYERSMLLAAVAAWRDAVSSDRRITSVDLSGLRERSPFFHALLAASPPRWGKARVVQTHVCPEVTLREGWAAVLGRHKARQRSNWRRKWSSLEQLGTLEFAETSDPREIEAVFPRLFQLYTARWRAKQIRGAFAEERYAVQLEGARQLGDRGLVRLSLLRLVGEVIAFAYAVRGIDSSTSYVLAHDARFEVFSPGLLLLTRLLEAAANRGDAFYDFSLGEAPYKAIWASGEQRVFCVLWGRGSRLTALKRWLWTGARSITALKRLKQAGIGALLGDEELPDAPGFVAGRPGTWFVYEAGGERDPAGYRFRPLEYREMRTLFSPRLLALALERHYRGDRALAIERDGGALGAVWEAAPPRWSTVIGGGLEGSDGSVYYHPVVAPGRSLAQVVPAFLGARRVVMVTSTRLSQTELREAFRFSADFRFRARRRGPRAVHDETPPTRGSEPQ